MLYITTDIPDTRWLVYILEEFARLNRAEFPIQVVSPQKNQDLSYVISYSSLSPEGICLPDRSQIQQNGKPVWLSESIFVLEGTTTDDCRYALPYDLFWNAFVFLSRLEEYQSEATGKKIKSYSSKHPREDKSTFGIPVVNHLFNKLEQLIRTNFPALTFSDKQKPVIEYSHDVDYIQKTLQIRVKQTAFNSFNTLKSIPTPARFIEQARKTIVFLFATPSYWCFEYWKDLETRYDTRSIFYVYACLKKKSLRSWFLDPSYDIVTHQQLQQTLQALIEEGFEVGLHGSVSSATNAEMLSQEKTFLEEAVQSDISKIRQHWLWYEEQITPYIHNKLFDYDSTIGWNDCIGFRSGCASRYRPYDHESQKPFEYMVTPQVLMDSHIFDYSSDNVVCLKKKAKEMLEALSQFKSAHVSISWHQRVCSSDYGWNGLYEEILNHETHEKKNKTLTSSPLFV